ncbi:MAG: heme utilization protein [Rhodospirillaceae bacterium]|nr:heme utilization protein [Rhodospirillales bacterium]
MNRITCAAVAAILTVSTALPALAAGCIAPAEARAMQVRQLHVQLQVASLNCRGDDPSLPGKYASYIHRFGGPLTDNAKVLRGHFAKNGGNMDRYMTVLANDESQRAHLVDGYCESHTPLFDKLSALKPHDLEHFASANVDKPDRTICGSAPVKQASAETKPKAKAKKAEPTG